MVGHMIERQARQGDVQGRHVSEVGCAQTTGMMNLLEEHLLWRSRDRSPLTDATLKRPQLTVLKPARVLSLQPLEQGDGLQPGTELQLLLKLWPDVLEGVLSGQPCPRPGLE